MSYGNLIGFNSTAPGGGVPLLKANIEDFEGYAPAIMVDDSNYDLAPSYLNPYSSEFSQYGWYFRNNSTGWYEMKDDFENYSVGVVSGELSIGRGFSTPWVINESDLYWRNFKDDFESYLVGSVTESMNAGLGFSTEWVVR